MPITMRSCFSTPGVRGFGNLGIVQDGELAGMQICAVVRSAFKEYRQAPCFGWLTMKNKKIGGDKDVKSGFFALFYFHPPNAPEQVGVAGVWAPDRDEIDTYQGTWLHRCGKRVPEGPGQWLDCFWFEWSYFSLFETNVTVVHSPDLVTSDPDIFFLRGSLHEVNYKPVFAACPQEPTTEYLLGLLAPKHQAIVVPIAPEPPSGIISTVASFNEIPRSVAWVGNRLFLGGATPGEPFEIVIVEHEGEQVMGVALGAPVGGIARLRVLERCTDLNSSDVDDAWRHEPAAVALRLQEIDADVTQRAVALVVPSGATHAFGLEYSTVFTLTLIETSDGFAAVHERSTALKACGQVAAWAKQRGGVDVASVLTTVANEVRLQGIPEKHDNLARAVITFRGSSLATAVAVAPELAWRGDRELTLEQPLAQVDLERIFARNFPSLGWRVPELEPARNGAQRKRKRNKGFVLVEQAETNRVLYCMETKVLQLELALWRSSARTSSSFAAATRAMVCILLLCRSTTL